MSKNTYIKLTLNFFFNIMNKYFIAQLKTWEK